MKAQAITSIEVMNRFQTGGSHEVNKIYQERSGSARAGRVGEWGIFGLQVRADNN